MVPVTVFSLSISLYLKEIKITNIQLIYTSCKNPLQLLIFLKSFKNKPSLVNIPYWNPKISHKVLGSKSTQDSVSKSGKMKRESDERVKKGTAKGD